MKLIESVIWGNLLFHYILMVVLIGILIHQKIEKKGKRKGIIPYIIICSSIAIFMIIDTLRYFGVEFSTAFLWSSPFLAITIGSGILWTSYYLNDCTNRHISFAVFFMTFVIASSEVLKIVYTSWSYWLYGSAATFIATLLLYYVIVNFLRGKRGACDKKINWENIFYWGVSFLVIVSLVFVVIGIGPGEGAVESSSELIIYNWVDYLDEGDALIVDFSKEFGIDVTLKYYKGDDIAFNELRNGSVEYDVVVLNDALIREGIMLNMFEELDHKNIVNLRGNDYLSFSYDEGNVYSVPYMKGTTGLIVNTKYIDDYDSWDVLWNVEYNGKVGIMNDYLEGFGMALRYVGASVNSEDSNDIGRSYDFLKLQKNIVAEYAGVDRIKEMLLSEEIWAAQIYGDSANLVMKDREEFVYVIPKEGAVQWVDNFVIPKGAKNKGNAEIFMNYMLRPEVGVRAVDYLEIPSANEKTNRLASVDIAEFGEADIARLEFIDLGKSRDVDEEKKRLWRELIG